MYKIEREIESMSNILRIYLVSKIDIQGKGIVDISTTNTFIELKDYICVESSKQFGGCTVYNSTGYYTNKKGETVKLENTYIIEIISNKYKRVLREYGKLVSANIKKVIKQESVLAMLNDEIISY